jgi:hypothetical protein
MGDSRLLEDTLEQSHVGNHGREMQERVGDGKWSDGSGQETAYGRNATRPIHDGTT